MAWDFWGVFLFVSFFEFGVFSVVMIVSISFVKKVRFAQPHISMISGSSNKICMSIMVILVQMQNLSDRDK